MDRRKTILRAVKVLALGVLAARPGAAPEAAARMRRTTKRYDIRVVCTSSGQFCAPRWPDPPLEFKTTGAYACRFVADPAGCSDIKPYFYLDGVQFFTEWLAPGEETAFGSFLPGRHTLQLQAEGRIGGCNTGSLGLWKGTLWLTTSERVRRRGRG